MFTTVDNMENSINLDQTPRSEGVWSGATLFAQRLESIKSPVCNIYAPIVLFLQRGGGVVPLGLSKSYPTPEIQQKIWHMGGVPPVRSPLSATQYYWMKKNK